MSEPMHLQINITISQNIIKFSFVFLIILTSFLYWNGLCNICIASHSFQKSSSSVVKSKFWVSVKFYNSYDMTLLCLVMHQTSRHALCNKYHPDLILCLSHPTFTLSTWSSENWKCEGKKLNVIKMEAWKLFNLDFCIWISHISYESLVLPINVFILMSLLHKQT